jgi:hypothetical protein
MTDGSLLIVPLKAGHINIYTMFLFIISVANVLFVESRAGVGFSYSNLSSD